MSDNNRDESFKWKIILPAFIMSMIIFAAVMVFASPTPQTQLMTINGEAVEYRPFTPGSTAIGILKVPEQLEGKDVIYLVPAVCHSNCSAFNCHIYCIEPEYYTIATIDEVAEWRGESHYRTLYPNGTVQLDLTEDQIFGIVVRRSL